MGTQITPLLVSKNISISDLRDKKLAVDAFNVLYQFLSTIRGRDGSQLMDSRGRVTSHLTGLFSRTTRLMQAGLKLTFVFDGEPPKLKEKERRRRHELKQEAKARYKEAEAREDIGAMKKYAMRTTTLTPELVDEAKELITALGLPVVQAPSEGEAQAAYMASKGDVDYIVSQDADALLFKAPFVVKNLAITQRRKKPNQLSYEAVEPELISLSENLKALNINQDQLICLAMLVGTDYNIGGIKGIGPKKALPLVIRYKTPDKIFKEAEWAKYFDLDWKDVFNTFKKIPTTDDYNLKWEEPNHGKVVNILCDEHDFSKDRVKATLNKLSTVIKKQDQKGLQDFF